MASRHDVIVVGGGVVGAAAALALRQQGLRVALVERGARPAPAAVNVVDMRVYAIAPGSIRFLEALGAWSRIDPARISPYRRMQVWESSPEHSLDFDTSGLVAARLGCIVEDGVLREALWAGLDGVDVYPGQQPVSCRHADGVSQLELSDGSVMQAALVIAAEGADSPLRDWAGIETSGWDYPQRALVCHVQTEHPHQGTAYQRFLPEGPLAFLPLADGRSSIVWSTRTADAEALLSLDDSAFLQRLEQAIQHRLGRLSAPTRRLSFPLRLMHAGEYVKPGLALVGDSAHVVHPLAGQGVNLGLADVAELVEVLSLARQQRRDWTLRVLQRYERRRKSANLEMLALTDGLYRLFRENAPGLKTAREAGLFLLDRLGPLKQPLTRRALGL